MNIRAVIQARTGSTRLPNKILMDLGGKTMLERVIERCHQIRGLDGPPIVAFAQNVPEACDAICEKAGADVRRGSEDDVLARYWTCAVAYELDAVLRVTADCPLIDPHLNGLLVADYRARPCDYIGPGIGWPNGILQEIISTEALAEAVVHATEPGDREHVIHYTIKHGRIRLVAGHKYDLSVDTQEDLDRVRALVQEAT